MWNPVQIRRLYAHEVNPRFRHLISSYIKLIFLFTVLLALPFFWNTLYLECLSFLWICGTIEFTSWFSFPPSRMSLHSNWFSCCFSHLAFELAKLCWHLSYVVLNSCFICFNGFCLLFTKLVSLVVVSFEEKVEISTCLISAMFNRKSEC